MNNVSKTETQIYIVSIQKYPNGTIFSLLKLLKSQDMRLLGFWTNILLYIIKYQPMLCIYKWPLQLNYGFMMVLNKD